MPIEDEKLNATYEAIDKVMALASAPLTGDSQIEFELQALGLYLGMQLSMLQSRSRARRIEELIENIQEAIEGAETKK